jgi:hypothetical protein
VDTTTELFGSTWGTPIVLAPVGGHKMFNPEGEIAVARAAKAKGHLQILSTVTTSSVEDVIAARGGPIWYQLYPTSSWDVRLKVVKRAEAAGCPVLVLTVDLSGGRNLETADRFKKLDTRRCESCHEPGPTAVYKRRPMFDGIDMKGVGVNDAALTWDDVKRLKDSMKMKLVVKGIETHEDAEVWTASSSRTTVGAPPRPAGRRSTSCPKWSRRLAAACRCWWMADSAAGQTSSRHWPLARVPSPSDGRISGACRRSVSRASKPCSISCAASWN